MSLVGCYLGQAMYENPKPVKYFLKHAAKFRQATCKDCGSHNFSVGKLLTGAGSSVFPWYCVDCYRRTNIYEPKHEYILYTAVFEDRTQNECQYCGKIGAELHHVMPRHLAPEDCEKWPTVYLCQEHHMQWHNTVTPNMCDKD